MEYKVLTPREFSGDFNGDYGYEINGVKSENSYASMSAAKNAMYRKVEKMMKELETVQ